MMQFLTGFVEKLTNQNDENNEREFSGPRVSDQTRLQTVDHADTYFDNENRSQTISECDTFQVTRSTRRRGF